MKHVIIPTDLSIRSLQPVHEVVRHYENEPVQITLLHLLEMPAGIGDLLFRLHRAGKGHELPLAYKNACEIISGRYCRNIPAVRTALEYGSTSRFLSNLLTGLKADAIFLPENPRFERPFKESVDILPLLRRAPVPVIYTAGNAAAEAPATIGDLLLVSAAPAPAPALQTA